MGKSSDEQRIETHDTLNEKLFNEIKDRVPKYHSYDYFEPEYFSDRRKYINSLKTQSDLSQSQYDEWHDTWHDIMIFVRDNKINVNSVKKSIIDEIVKRFGIQSLKGSNKNDSDHELTKIEEDLSTIDNNITSDKDELTEIKENLSIIDDNITCKMLVILTIQFTRKLL